MKTGFYFLSRIQPLLFSTRLPSKAILLQPIDRLQLLLSLRARESLRIKAAWLFKASALYCVFYFFCTLLHITQV